MAVNLVPQVPEANASRDQVRDGDRDDCLLRPNAQRQQRRKNAADAKPARAAIAPPRIAATKSSTAVILPVEVMA
jgi:hypothetical protein